jgi:hypothetical protein
VQRGVGTAFKSSDTFRGADRRLVIYKCGSVCRYSFCEEVGRGGGDANDLCGAVLWVKQVEVEGCGVMEAKRARMVCGGRK